ncbi:MAG: hypothetical protein HQK96_20440 [Nitrospirae bacterium]|nr:hypothetical protein [Nitrospirota bacterium]
MESPSIVVLIDKNTKKQKRVPVRQFREEYGVFNPKFINKTDNKNNSPIAYYSSANPVVKENDSYFNFIFKDDRPQRMTGIINAIQDQIKIEEKAKFNRESDVAMMFNGIQHNFIGFIAKKGKFSDFISNVIIFIDWLGEKTNFKEHKSNTLEKCDNHTVVIVYTKNKAKSFFIHVLKSLILKYPNGGK